MKDFTTTLTINLHFQANTEEEAKEIIQEMHYSFIDPRDNSEIDNDILDSEVYEISS